MCHKGDINSMQEKVKKDKNKGILTFSINTVCREGSGKNARNTKHEKKRKISQKKMVFCHTANNYYLKVSIGKQKKKTKGETECTQETKSGHPERSKG